MKIDEYFDKIYVLNLHKRPARLDITNRRMSFCDIKFKVFGATDGSVMKKIWETYYKENQYFKNPNYLGCAISHLSIYADALENGYKKILILEDDNRINRNANDLFDKLLPFIPSDWNDLLYFGFIPLNEECTYWDYNLTTEFFINDSVFTANNLWGLYAYGISESLMKETLEVYDKEFPMELDRYFVTQIQPRKTSYAISPQLFAADDGISDNSGVNEVGMLERSIDTRFARIIDYI